MKTMLNQIITAQTATGSSAAVASDQLIAVSVIATSSTGTPVGTMTLQASNDILTTGTATPSNWVTIATVAMGAGSFFIPKTELCYEWIRVTLTLDSGSMSTSVRIKGISL